MLGLLFWLGELRIKRIYELSGASGIPGDFIRLFV